jgi:hypothetical protein
MSPKIEHPAAKPDDAPFDDRDNPEWTEADFARALAPDQLPAEVREAMKPASPEDAPWSTALRRSQDCSEAAPGPGRCRGLQVLRPGLADPHERGAACGRTARRQQARLVGKLTMTDAYSTLMKRVMSVGVGGSDEINPCWRHLLSGLQQLLAASPDAPPDAVVQALGYRHRLLPAGIGRNEDLPKIARLLDKARNRDGDGLQPSQLELVAQLVFLGRQALLEEFVAWADGQGFQIDMNLGRFFWYRRLVLHTLGARSLPPAGAYLEIGAGSGTFAVMVREEWDHRQTIIVDLPEMLMNAADYIAAQCPRAPVRVGEPPREDAEPGFWLLEPADIRLVPDGLVGLAVNINSMMEMDEEVRDSYLREIYRTARRGGVLFNVNRRQERMSRRDGSSYDNNPLLYPYRTTDQVLRWEVDACQMACKSDRFFSPPAYTILRLAVLA